MTNERSFRALDAGMRSGEQNNGVLLHGSMPSCVVKARQSRGSSFARNNMPRRQGRAEGRSRTSFCVALRRCAGQSREMSGFVD
jgi:hypothetical protein